MCYTTPREALLSPIFRLISVLHPSSGPNALNYIHESTREFAQPGLSSLQFCTLPLALAMLRGSLLSSARVRGRSAVASARPGSPGRCERAAPGATRGAAPRPELCAPQIAQTSKTPGFERPRGTPKRFRGGCGAAIGAPFGGGCSGGRQLPADPSASGSGRRARFGGARRGGDF